MVNKEFVTMLPDIPQPPQKVLDAIMELIQTNNNTYRFSKDSNSYYQNFNTYNIEGIIKDWVDQYIGPLFGEERYYPVVQTISNSLAVHVDTNRTYVYNFLLDCGGENVCTFWTNKVDDDADVTYNTVIPKGIWHRLNTGDPHGVKNIQSTRIAISVGNVTKINRDAMRQQRKYYQELTKKSSPNNS
jgi:hypothetical protein